MVSNRLTELGSAAELNDLAHNLNRLNVSGNPLTVDAIRIILESMNRQKSTLILWVYLEVKDCAGLSGP